MSLYKNLLFGASLFLLVLGSGCGDDNPAGLTPIGESSGGSTSTPDVVLNGNTESDDPLVNTGTLTADTTYAGAGDVASGNGLSAGNITISLPEDQSLSDVTITIAETTLPGGGLPAGVTQVEEPFALTIDDANLAKLNGPLTITMTYGDEGLTNEHDLLLFSFDGAGNYFPVRVVTQNSTINSITFETRAESSFVLTTLDTELLSTFNTGFQAEVHGWSISNFGFYNAPNGNSMGMSGVAVWLYNNGAGTTLHDVYTDNIQKLTAVKAQLAQAKTWGDGLWRTSQKINGSHLVKLLKGYLSLLNRPLVLTLGFDDTTRLAAVVYGYTETDFLFYDPRTPDVEQTLPYTSTGFGEYDALNYFGYISLDTFGSSENFQTLKNNADAGFLNSTEVVMESPDVSVTIDAQEAALQGTVNGSLAGGSTIYATVKGVGQIVPLVADAFDATIGVSCSFNTIVLVGGVDITTDNNWFPGSPVSFADVESSLACTLFLATLTWESVGDVDIYVTDPEGATTYFSNSTGTSGLVLDFDNTVEFGPEKVTLTEGVSDGSVLTGGYVVRVHYYSGGVSPVIGSVNIVVNQGLSNQVERTIGFSISEANSSNSSPGSIGDDWANIATVNIENGTISQN